MSKITYWKCVDCNSMINDSNMHENPDIFVFGAGKTDVKYAEFCYGCMNYYPEVVIAYE